MANLITGLMWKTPILSFLTYSGCFGILEWFFLVISNYTVHETTWELILRKEEDACEKNKFSA
jgi:hypothetical protein